MHPAPSIILFTSLSGLGLGLFFMLGLGFPDVTGWTAFAFFFLAYALTVGGLIFSTFHLGHPERALLAFTQWRSSWLSREGWLVCLTLLIMAPYAIGLVFFETRIVPLGYVGALLAIATVGATAMIYAQLKTVPRWHHWTTPALFLAYALSGGLLLSGQVALASPVIVATAALQFLAWAIGDTRFSQSGSTVGTATGLGSIGKVRLFEPPHTGTNYLMKEMVFAVGRRHARKLRLIGIGLMAVVPAILLLFPFSHGLAALAIFSHVAGVIVLRWLFFAEAEHTVGLYYGRTA